jgi:Helix-turn-helix domain
VPVAGSELLEWGGAHLVAAGVPLGRSRLYKAYRLLLVHEDPAGHRDRQRQEYVTPDPELRNSLLALGRCAFVRLSTTATELPEILPVPVDFYSRIRENIGMVAGRVQLYSVAEAARRLGIDPSLVRAYIRQGRIVSERSEPPYVITEASLARFERNRPVRGRPRRTRDIGAGGTKR